MFQAILVLGRLSFESHPDHRLTFFVCWVWQCHPFLTDSPKHTEVDTCKKNENVSMKLTRGRKINFFSKFSIDQIFFKNFTNYLKNCAIYTQIDSGVSKVYSRTHEYNLKRRERFLPPFRQLYGVHTIANPNYIFAVLLPDHSFSIIAFPSFFAHLQLFSAYGTTSKKKICRIQANPTTRKKCRKYPAVS